VASRRHRAQPTGTKLSLNKIIKFIRKQIKFLVNKNMIQTQDLATVIDKIIHPTELKLSLFNKKNLGYLFFKKLN
jgi:hypothetical protein